MSKECVELELLEQAFNSAEANDIEMFGVRISECFPAKRAYDIAQTVLAAKAEEQYPHKVCRYCIHGVMEEDQSVGVPEHYICDNPSLPEDVQDSEDLGCPDMDCPYFDAIIHEKCDVCGRTINVPLWLWDKVYHGMFADVVCCSSQCMKIVREKEKREVEARW